MYGNKVEHGCPRLTESFQAVKVHEYYRDTCQSSLDLAKLQVRLAWLELPLRESPLVKLLQQEERLERDLRPRQEERTRQGERPRQEVPMLQLVVLLQPGELMLQPEALLQLGERPQLAELLLRGVLQAPLARQAQARRPRCPRRFFRQPLPPRWSHLYSVWWPGSLWHNPRPGSHSVCGGC